MKESLIIQNDLELNKAFEVIVSMKKLKAVINDIEGTTRRVHSTRRVRF